MTDQLAQLKESASQELEFCNHEITPNVCKMVTTEKGKQKIVDLICEYVGNYGMTISEAIVAIERERSTTFDELA